jgi:hypothetical protein
METIYEQLNQAGVPLDHYGSNLFALVTPVSRAILEKNRVEYTVFFNKGDHQTWFNIPLAYPLSQEDKK